MESFHASLLKAPYGLSFSIEELMELRAWAESRHLRLTVALDQTIDGAEFEEMLIIAPPQRERRTLTLWRTRSTIYAQTPQGRPRGFETVAELLQTLRPAEKPRRFWFNFRRPSPTAGV